MKRRTQPFLAGLLCVVGFLGSAQKTLSQTGSQPQQPQAAPVPCVAPKKPSRWDQIKERAKQRIEAAGQTEVNKAGGAISKGTHGKADGTLIPSVPEIANGSQTQTKPCVSSAQGNSTH